MPDFEIVSGYVPGALGQIVSLHGSYYHEHWGFDSFFEAKVATELGSFMLEYDPARDGLWLAIAGGRIEGSVAIDGSRAFTDGAHLRWFIVADALRGKGIGGRLIRTALDFCQEQGYSKVYLHTFAGLDAARQLYEREGFELVDEHNGSQWGVEVLEQRFECHSDAKA
ncbi:MAG: GNAT family N-acetyltransferase [Actinobacteria bacterium HGW-Actinobacteria-6]|jgi:GNAT superfamily N-acetyltransferase|nr:MAG: GNAT family N-acetyltransferase [Actinobacteria bacterium HGW-Actinobacteria-6]